MPEEDDELLCDDEYEEERLYEFEPEYDVFALWLLLVLDFVKMDIKPKRMHNAQ